MLREVMRMTGNKGKYWPGCAVTGLFVLIEGVLFARLASTGLLPAGLLLAAGGVLLVLAAAVYLLVRRFDRRTWFAIGCVLAAVLLTVTGIGWHFVRQGVGTLDLITRPETEVAGVGVYVPKEAAAQSIQDTRGMTFGVLATLDRGNTDAALTQLTALLNEEIPRQEYASLPALLDALLNKGEVQAILLNVAFLDLLEDLEGYETAAADLRQLFEVQVAATTTTTPASPSTTTPTTTAPAAEDNTFSLYISGIDATGRVSVKSRSDVNILATVNVETGQILLISTPRDYYVPLSISGGVPDKLTHAGIYGIDVSVDTMEMLYGTQIDYYFRVNFTGFKKIIDALGGVTVYSDYTFTDYRHNFVKGENFFNGEQALAFARDRYHVPGGDRQRGRNQMAVIRGVIDKMTSPALLTNFAGIMEGVADSFETSMPYEEIAALVRQQLSTGMRWNVTSYSVNGTGATRAVYSMGSKAYVMIPDKDTVAKAQALIRQVREGQVPTP